MWVSGLPVQNVTMDEGCAPLLPDSLVYQIFLSLGPADVLAAGLVCRQWHAVSRDEFLWREQFYRYYQVARHVPRHPGQGPHVAPWSTRLAGREAGPPTHCHHSMKPPRWSPTVQICTVVKTPCGPHLDRGQPGHG